MISAAPSWSRTRLASFMISRIGPPFEHGPDGRGAHQRRQQHLEARRRLGRRAELKFSVGVDLDHALVPAVLVTDHLVDRQHVEIFVGEDDARSLRHVVDAVVPGDVAHARQRRTLPLAQDRIDLDHVDMERLVERRQHAQRTQRIGHHGAAAGTELDQPQELRRAHLLPHRGGPQAQAARRTSG